MTIITVAGRRVDPPNAETPRFPLENVDLVRERVRNRLARPGTCVLVCAPAAGVDLLALEVAVELGIRRRVVLPFERHRFRKTSVADRPGDWGPLYDRICDEVAASGDLVVFDYTGSDEATFIAANEAILDEAVALVPPGESPASVVTALIVWEGASRGEGDVTEAFARQARQRGIPVEEIRTM